MAMSPLIIISLSTDLRKLSLSLYPQASIKSTILFSPSSSKLSTIRCGWFVVGLLSVCCRFIVGLLAKIRDIH